MGSTVVPKHTFLHGLPAENLKAEAGSVGSDMIFGRSGNGNQLAGRVVAAIASPNASSTPNLHRGAHGPAVAELQRELKAAGFDPGPADGSFGKKTEAAVRSFQAARGLVVDGWVGAQTWGELGRSAPVPPSSGSSSSLGGPISRSEVLNRAMYWVNQNVPYDQNKHDTDSGGRSYRTDCSGLVSMALHLDSEPSTVNMTDYVHPISWADLKPGDIVGTLGSGTGGNAGHVVIFNGWRNAAHTEFNTLEERGGVGAVQYHREINYKVTDKDPKTHKVLSTYIAQPYRYNNIVEEERRPVRGAF